MTEKEKKANLPVIQGETTKPKVEIQDANGNQLFRALTEEEFKKKSKERANRFKMGITILPKSYAQKMRISGARERMKEEINRIFETEEKPVFRWDHTLRPFAFSKLPEEEAEKRMAEVTRVFIQLYAQYCKESGRRVLITERKARSISILCDWITGHPDGVMDPNSHFILFGRTGSGKTMLIKTVFTTLKHFAKSKFEGWRKCLEPLGLGDHRKTTMIFCPSTSIHSMFCDAEKGPGWSNKRFGKGFLCVDDLGEELKEGRHYGQAIEPVGGLLKKRLEDDFPGFTIATSNKSKEELIKHYGDDKLKSRFGGVRFYEMIDLDYREEDLRKMWSEGAIAQLQETLIPYEGKDLNKIV